MKIRINKLEGCSMGIIHSHSLVIGEIYETAGYEPFRESPGGYYDVKDSNGIEWGIHHDDVSVIEDDNTSHEEQIALLRDALSQAIAYLEPRVFWRQDGCCPDAYAACRYGTDEAWNVTTHHDSGGKHTLQHSSMTSEDVLLSVGKNSYSVTHPLQKRHADKVGEPHRIYLHAEIDALIRCKDIDKAHRLVVLRYYKDGTEANAAPCRVCRSALAATNIKIIQHT